MKKIHRVCKIWDFAMPKSDPTKLFNSDSDLTMDNDFPFSFYFRKNRAPLSTKFPFFNRKAPSLMDKMSAGRSAWCLNSPRTPVILLAFLPFAITKRISLIYFLDRTILYCLFLGGNALFLF